MNTICVELELNQILVCLTVSIMIKFDSKINMDENKSEIENEVLLKIKSKGMFNPSR